MAENMLNIKAYSPLKLHSGLTGKCPAICHYSYNLPLCTNQVQVKERNYISLFLQKKTHVQKSYFLYNRGNLHNSI